MILFLMMLGHQAAWEPGGLCLAGSIAGGQGNPTRVPFLSSAVARVETAEPVIALTFDACATAAQSNEFDQPVFDILSAEKIPATVFVTGRWLQAHPAAARDLAASTLIEFGNHSFDHRRLAVLSEAEIGREIDRTAVELGALSRRAGALRPPAGDWNQRVVRVAAGKGLSTVLWDVVSGDAGGHVPAAQMVETVSAQARAGSIVIFHINGRGPFTKDALPEIIKRLRARGMRFVFVSDLLRLPGAKLVPAPRSTRVPPRQEKEKHAGFEG